MKNDVIAEKHRKVFSVGNFLFCAAFERGVNHQKFDALMREKCSSLQINIIRCNEEGELAA